MRYRFPGPPEVLPELTFHHRSTRKSMDWGETRRVESDWTMQQSSILLRDKIALSFSLVPWDKKICLKYRNLSLQHFKGLSIFLVTEGIFKLRWKVQIETKKFRMSQSIETDEQCFSHLDSKAWFNEKLVLMTGTSLKLADFGTQLF